MSFKNHQGDSKNANTISFNVAVWVVAPTRQH